MASGSGIVDRGTERETPVELIRSLAVLAEPPGGGHAEIARALGLSGGPTAPDYSDLFLFQLYPYASVHLGNEGMLGGAARERIAGFWRAVGRTPPAEPDHLSALLALYATLAEEARSAEPAERVLLDRGRRALLEEHLVPWIFAFLDRVVELADGGYAEWADLLNTTLMAEVAMDGPALPLPAHLKEAEPLPDPRVDGAAPFVPALLAPVRSGALLARADLASIALTADLGLRAGERRYALEHLLAQDAAATLSGLAAEVGRQAAAHEERRTSLGAAAEWSAERARTSEALLTELAEVAREEADDA